MKSITLTISDIDQLNSIKKNLSEKRSLTKKQQDILSHFLNQLPSTDTLLAERTPLDKQLEAKLWDMEKIHEHLEYWVNLFGNLPGWDYCPFCTIVDSENIRLLRKNVIAMAFFAPSFSHNANKKKEGYEVHLRDDSTALFELPTLEDAEAYPELYNFKGTWKEAYLLLIKTLKKGWPIEEFPEELQKFLPTID